MPRARTVGGLLTAVGVLAYAAGTVTAYPGRAFSVAAVMVGVALFATGGRGTTR